MKKWFLERFLPMWAKETVYKDNRRLVGELKALEQENQQLRAYIRGMAAGGRILRLRGVEGAAPYRMTQSTFGDKKMRDYKNVALPSDTQRCSDDCLGL